MTAGFNGAARMEDRAILESHAAWAGARQATEVALAQFGFTPDHFREPCPTSYRNHMTLKVAMNPKGITAWECRERFFAACLGAEQLLARLDLPGFYLETEVYPSRNSRSYACDHTTSMADDRYLLLGIGGVCVAVPNRKTCDIHLKLCRRCVIGASVHVPPALTFWRTLCQTLGMYRVITATGSEVWTLLMAHPGAARDVFKRLDLYARDLGGIEKMTLESCVRFVSGGADPAELPSAYLFQ